MATIKIREEAQLSINPFFAGLIDDGRKKLEKALEAICGTKTIVFDNHNTMTMINLMHSVAWLKAHEVDQFIVMKTPVKARNVNVVFLFHETNHSGANFVEAFDKIRTDKSRCYIYYLPDMDYVSHDLIRSNEEVSSNIEFSKALPIRWFPTLYNAPIMMSPHVASHILLAERSSYFYQCAQALEQIDAICAADLSFFARGNWSEKIIDSINKLRITRPPQFDHPPGNPSFEVQSIVILDRWIDPLTPLLTQTTYGGYLEEQKIISDLGALTLDGIGKNKDKSLKINLSNDVIFSAIRDCPFMTATSAISKKLAMCKEFRDNNNVQQMSVAEIAFYTKSLDVCKTIEYSAENHLEIMEAIRPQFFAQLCAGIDVEHQMLLGNSSNDGTSFIMNEIVKGSDMIATLRLLCIYSLTKNGLPEKQFSAFAHQITVSYGLEGVKLFVNLVKMGLIRHKAVTGIVCCDYVPFSWKRSENVTESSFDFTGENRNPVAIPYNGYIPTLVRTVDQGLKSAFVTWKSLPGVAKQITPSKTVVMVIGGVTSSEICSLKNLGFAMVASTEILTGQKLLQNLATTV